MDGQELLYSLRQNLDEDSSSIFLDARTSYRYLWESARDFVIRTSCLRSTQSITTVASQAAYTLNADFLGLYIRDRNKNFVIKYNDGSDNTFIPWKAYEDIIYMDDTDAVLIPNYFTIIDVPTLSAQISSTATAAGAATGGQCVLADSTAPFSNVSAGDVVHNITDGSDGIVLSKTSTSALVIALFGGTNNDVTSSDSYIIQPQGRVQVVLNPPPSTAGHTVTVEYVQSPAPVFSSYGMYRIQAQWHEAIVNFAAWKYKYKDREPNLGDKLHQMYEYEIRRASAFYKDSMFSNDLHVSFRKR